MYYGLDVRTPERFQSLVPPLPESNAKILVPKYHILLEGLVHFVMNPPGLTVIGVDPVWSQLTAKTKSNLNPYQG